MHYLKEILDIRKQRRVSVAKLSRITGIPDDRIYKWESGVGNPKAEDAEKLKKWLANPEKVPHETTQEPEAPSELITGLLKQQNNLMAILTGVIQEQKEGVVDKIKTIDANLNGVIGRTESLHYDLVSGRATVLRSLSRIEGRAEEELLQEADSIRRSLAVAKNERYKKAAGGKKGR